MKFSTYSPTVKPNTINARVTSSVTKETFGADDKVYGAWANAAGQIAQVVQKKQDDDDAADIMAARSEITQRMNESLYGDNGIVTTSKGKNAEGMANRISESIQDITNDVAGNYNGRVRYQLTKKYLPQDLESYGRMGMQTENREMESYRTNAYNSALSSGTEYIAANYLDSAAVSTKFAELDDTISSRASTLGWDFDTTEKEKRKVRTSGVSSMVTAAMANDDYDSADSILRENRRYMDQDTFNKLFANVQSTQKQKADYVFGKDLFEKYWNDTTHTFDREGAMKEIESKYGANSKVVIGGMNLDEANDTIDKSGLIGMRMPHGSEGCVEGYVRVGSYISPWLAQHQEQINVDRIMEEAQKPGGPGVVSYSADNVQYGDGIIYVDTNGETQHVVMAAGSGAGDYTYIGNSSSQERIIRGGDYREMGGLKPAYIIKTGTDAGQTRSNFDPSRMGKIENYMDAFVADRMKAWNQQQSQMVEDFIGRMNRGETGADMITEVLNSSLDEDKKSALLSKLKTANKTASGASKAGSNRYIGSYSEVEDMDTMSEYYERMADPNDTISAADQRRYNKAARKLNYYHPEWGQVDMRSNEVVALIRDKARKGYSYEQIWNAIPDDALGSAKEYYFNIAYNSPINDDEEE